jgi:cyclopropane fatty-acyl-phospholipid synthase-like methyltransferase
VIPAPTRRQILERNRLEYDDAADPYWRLTVYDAVHGGWWFSSIGGRPALDWIAARAGLDPGAEVLELCSGLGDSARYLALRHGCRPTGVELNRWQVASARRRLALRSPELRRRVRFVHGDVLGFRRGGPYDAVYAMDVLLEDRAGALARARALLRPGGCAAFADVLAGPAITPEVRRFVWEEDGILGLPGPAEQREQLAAAGFEAAEVVDRTDLAIDCFARVEAASERHREELVAAKGEARYRSWLDNAGTYRRYFEKRALIYALFAARSPL